MVGIQNNPLPIQGRITQAAPSQAKVNQKAPKTDTVLDLSQAEGLESELKSHDASNTDFIKINDDISISVKELSPEELTGIIEAIKNRALDGDMKLIPGIADKLILVTDQTITINGKGTEIVDQPESSPIEQAEAVIEKSNANSEDAPWSFANGTSASLTFQNPADKPAPWNNHFFMADDKAFIYQTKNDTRTTTMPGEQTLELSLDQAKELGLPQELLEEVKTTGKLRYLPKDNYQTMLKHDFNFNDAFDEFQTAEQFTEALKYTYPERVEALGQDNFNELAERIYSYASAGEDTDGGINVQEMQGMLYALDPEIRLSSNSNTPMKAQTLFKIDENQLQLLPAKEQSNYVKSNQGGYVPLSITADQYQTLSPEDQAKFTSLGDRFVPLGDNKHGRATILTTRHIMEKLDQTEIPREPVSFKFSTGITSLFGPNDRFIRDSSGSMTTKWGVVQRAVDEVLQEQGVLEVGESLADKVDLNLEQKGSLSVKGQSIQVDKASLDASQFKLPTDNLSTLMKDAYTSFQSADKTDTENRKDFAEFIGLPESEIFNENGEVLDSNKLTNSFDKLLHDQGRLKPGQKLSDNMSELINKDGSIKLAEGKTYMPTVMTLDDDKFDDYIQDFSNVLTDAYAAVSSPDKKEHENQAHFAQLLGVSATDIFNSNGQLQGDKVMDILGDTRGVVSESSIGSTGEAAFKGVITALLFDKDYTSGTQMNVLIDEPLQDMEYLKLAQTIADAKGVDVRFISMPTSITDVKAVEKNPEDFMVFVDMQSMDIASKAGQPQTLSFTSQEINDQGLIVETEQKMPIEYFEGTVHGKEVDYSKKPDGFKGSFVPLQGYDEKGKIINKIGSGSE